MDPLRKTTLFSRSIRYVTAVRLSTEGRLDPVSYITLIAGSVCCHIVSENMYQNLAHSEVWSR